MIPYNSTLLDAIRYHRHLITDDDIVVGVESLQEIVDVVEDKIDFDNKEELSAILDQKQEFIDRVEEAYLDKYGRVCSLEEVVEVIKTNAPSDFFEKVKGAYEYRFGKVYDMDLDTLSELMGQTIKEAPDVDSLVIDNVDLDLLEKQRKMLYVLLDRLNIIPGVTTQEIEALDGILNMLDSWSD